MHHHVLARLLKRILSPNQRLNTAMCVRCVVCALRQGGSQLAAPAGDRGRGCY